MTVVLLAACEDHGFEPLAPGREALVSVYGYLDPSADTQWIRVTPIRELKTAAPDSFDAVVTLTEAGTGRLITLRDSLIRFAGGGATADTGTAFVHDFWTTERIEPGATYHFTATRPGEPAAEADIKVPDRVVLTISLHQFNFPTDKDFARVSGANYVPFWEQRLGFVDACGSGVDTLPTKSARSDNGTALLMPLADTVSRRGTGQCGTPRITSRHLWVAASDSPWPVSQVTTVPGLGNSQQSTTVSNALGFLGGLIQAEVPYSTCTYAPQSKWPSGTSSGIPGPKQAYFPEWCVLTFDSLAASSSGRVIESRCGDGPVEGATVRYTALDDSAQTQRMTTAADGAFEFGALRPGKRYNLYVYGKLEPVLSQNTNVYSTVDDTVTFSPGERRTGDLYIERQTACDQQP